MEIMLDYLGGLNVITRILVEGCKGFKDRKRRCEDSANGRSDGFENRGRGHEPRNIHGL